MASNRNNTNEQLNELLAEEKLVELWPDYPCLYDVRSPSFKDRDRRQQAMEEIGKKIYQNIDWVKNKLRQLRNSFTKARKPGPSGSARRNPTKRTSWLLDKLQFLDPYVASRPTSNMDEITPMVLNAAGSDNDENGDLLSTLDEDGEDDLHGDDHDTSTPKSTKLPLRPRPKSMKKKIQEEEFKVMKGLATSIARSDENKKAKSEGGECEAFGSFIIESMKKLDPTMQHIVQYHINNIMFQAQMGMLGQVQVQMSVPQPQNNVSQQHNTVSQQQNAVSQQQNNQQVVMQTSSEQPQFTLW